MYITAEDMRNDNEKMVIELDKKPTQTLLRTYNNRYDLITNTLDISNK